MRKYKYTAVNIEKKKFTGSFFAEDEAHLRRQLAQQNLYLVSCKPMTDATPNAFFSATGKIQISELTTFCRQFAIMLNSGISILDCLAQLREQHFSAFMKKILYMIYDDVKVGVLLSKAMEKHKKVFPEFFRSMIYVGEVSGSLEKVLNSLADYYENEVALKRKIKGALAYPIMMGVMLIGIVLLMLLLIVPQFEETLSTLNITEEEMNQLTVVVFAASRWVRAHGLTLLYVIVLIFALFFVLLRTEKGKMAMDVFKYRFPLTKNVQINLVASKFTKAMGLLLSSGMQMIEAMEVVQNLLGNRYAQKVFKSVIDDVRQGASLTFAMDAYKIFPQMLIQMLATGEKTGNVEDVLNRSVTFFDSQVESSLLRVTGIIQPVMLCLMGVVIGGMFIAVYSPMITIMQKDFTTGAAQAVLARLGGPSGKVWRF